MAAVRGFLSPLRSENFASPNSFRPNLSFAPNLSRLFHLSASSPFHSLPSQAARCPRLSSSILVKDTCFRCGRLGHFARDCRSRARCFHCGAPGHKRASCRFLKKETSQQISTKSLETEVVEDLWMTRSTGFEPYKAVDSLLLDPDVEKCLGNKLAFQALLPIGGSDGFHLDLVDPDLVNMEISEKVSVPPKARSIFPGNFNFGKYTGMNKGCIVSRAPRFRHRLKIHSLLAKGRRVEPALDLNWSTFGKRSSANFLALPLPSLMGRELKVMQMPKDMDSPLLEDYSSDSYSDADGVDTDKTMIDLSLAPYDVISTIEILDEFEGYYSEDDEGSVMKISPRSSHNAQEFDEASSRKILSPIKPEPKKMKVRASKKMQDLGPPISVRRSPRFLSK